MNKIQIKQLLAVTHQLEQSIKHQVLNYPMWVMLSLGLLFAQAAHSDEPETRATEVEVKDFAIDSRIRNYPATVETFSKQDIDLSVNAVTPAQTLKYLPSIQVRERFIGDRNGIIASRTIGAISSAQSMLYADGILLSNLLGNRWDFPPRWGMVSPEEIQNISMMYGPFSALYAGNSFGGVINIQTRMPEKFETHASVQNYSQSFNLYGTKDTFNGNHQTLSVGSRYNDFSFWIGADRLESQGQPMDYSVANKTGIGTKSNVTGFYQDKSEKNSDRLIFGAYAQDNTTQTNAKIKLAYDFSEQVKMFYTIGLWDADSKSNVQSYLKDADGNYVYNRKICIDATLTSNCSGTQSGNDKKGNYTVALAPSQSENMHIMQALNLQSRGNQLFDWQLALSDYNYNKDIMNSSNITANTSSNGNPYQNKTGKLNDLNGTGWTSFDTRLTFKPQSHLIDVGLHADQYELSSTTYNSPDWQGSTKTTFSDLSKGKTETYAFFAQDKWQLSPQWAVTAGGRQEFWYAKDGLNQTTNDTAHYQNKNQNSFSPKLSISFEPSQAWGYRLAYGRAYRYPTVGELYQRLNASSTSLVQNNPDLKPEQAISYELTAERRFLNGLIRGSLFYEERYDALISQTRNASDCASFGIQVNSGTCSFIQNVDHIRTKGIELSTEWDDLFITGLKFLGNATITDARVIEDAAHPEYQGNWNPRIPKQLYKGVLAYSPDQNWSMSLAARFSGRQFINLDNSDINSDTYKGASRYLLIDAKANYKFSDRLTASFGVDNLNNDKAYVSHPLLQRTFYGQLKFNY
jgi:iron complex outermembrane receptor protein